MERIFECRLAAAEPPKPVLADSAVFDLRFFPLRNAFVIGRDCFIVDLINRADIHIIILPDSRQGQHVAYADDVILEKRPKNVVDGGRSVDVRIGTG
jgi:hypothetical protein